MGKKLGRGILAHVLAVCFVAVTLFAAFPQTAMAAAGDYNAGDIAAINAIIDNNGLQWTKADPADGSVLPSDWTGVVWSDVATDKRITALRIAGKSLAGTLNVSGLTALTELVCGVDTGTSAKNQLTALDVSGCIALESLYCEGNSLTALNISNNSALVRLMCYDNQLTTLDVSNCTGLMALQCGGNDMPATPAWAGVAGLENVTAYPDGGMFNYGTQRVAAIREAAPALGRAGGGVRFSFCCLFRPLVSGLWERIEIVGNGLVFPTQFSWVKKLNPL